MSLFPLFVDLRDRPVLVVGAGVVAERKVAALRRAGAAVTVVAEQATAELRAQAERGDLCWLQQAFQPELLDGMWLTIAATDDETVNTAVAEAGHARQRWVNVVDSPQRCSVQIPAVIHREPLQIAISTGGSAPMLARRLRALLESLLPAHLGPLVALAQRFRTQIRQRLPELAARRRFYDWIYDGPVAQALAAQQPEQAQQALQAALTDIDGAPPQPGQVSLVGAGPGDPGLLTLAALQALNQADVILHDALVSAEVLDLARRDASLISVGKRGGGEHTAQAWIEQQLLEHAVAGRQVVRLKGGDPFIFGRGGEEIEFLRRHHIPYRVIPGITAALACAAYAGISLSHRHHARSVQLITAHSRQSLPTLDWLQLAQPDQTLAIYMGVAVLDAVQAALLEHGLAATTPFALIENGSRASQRTLSGPLHQLSSLAQHHQFASPSLLIVGRAAGMARGHGWFGTHIDGFDINTAGNHPLSLTAGRE